VVRENVRTVVRLPADDLRRANGAGLSEILV